jgi:hypothetical protein
MNFNDFMELHAERNQPSLKKPPRTRFELMDAVTTRLYTRCVMQLRLRIRVCLLAALSCGLPAWADESADQLERARLLRQFQETPSQAAKTPSLPAAAIEVERLRAAESLRTRQFEDSQWRKLIGDQQMQLHQPSTSVAPESQWRAQIFERDRQAQDLSADILRRDLEYRLGGRR